MRLQCELWQPTTESENERTNKHHVGVVVVKYLIPLLLSGCATFPVWEKVSEPAITRSWSQMSYADIQRICGGPNSPMRWTAGCAVRAGDHCAVFSLHSEEAAKAAPDHCPKASMGSHWSHELKHCDGYVHKHGC